MNDDDIRYLQKEQTPVKRATPSASFPRWLAARRRPKTCVVSPSGGPLADRELPQLTNDEVKRYSRHLIMPEVGVEEAAEAEGRQRALHRRRWTRVARRDVLPPPAWARSASSISTSSTSATCGGRSSGTPDVGRTKLASAKDRLNAINPTSMCRPTTRRCRRRTR